MRTFLWTVAGGVAAFLAIGAILEVEDKLVGVLGLFLDGLYGSLRGLLVLAGTAWGGVLGYRHGKFGVKFGE